VFDNIAEGEYEAEAQVVGYQTTTEHVSVPGIGSLMQVYIYLPRESETKAESPKSRGLLMAPKLQAEVDKGVDALRHHQFEHAREHFEKGVRMAPGNPDLYYLLGVAELGLEHAVNARANFDHALSLDPGHERTLVVLGELELNLGDAASAATTLEKAYQINGAGWRAQFLLAVAYVRSGRLREAEDRVQSAVTLVHHKSAEPLLLLGEIQLAEGRSTEAMETFQKLLSLFPTAPAAKKTQEILAELSTPRIPTQSTESPLGSLPMPSLPTIALAPPYEQPWAPLDIDSLEYPLAKDAPCSAAEILPNAERRLRSELKNFERFTATEHIEHEEIDRFGQPGPVRARNFDYVVFVYRQAEDALFLDEERVPLGRDTGFPSSLATTGLNNLGVAVLQPAERGDMKFHCEGLSSFRGRAAWQLRFEENKNSPDSIRIWRQNGTLYRIPLKGRIWISSTSFDLLRIETDLLQPVEALGLTRDHLRVDYGPVKFRGGSTTLWLPWSADMYMEFHGHRYHHRHYLTDYFLFEVDTGDKVGKPKETKAPPPPEQLVASVPRPLA
jgi:Flp pilus assembly protein TadD